VGFFSLFQRKSPVSKLSDKELVGLICNLLGTQIALGNASPGEPNRGRLEMPYARGYIFGVADTVLRRSGRMTDDRHALSLITVTHAKIFGKAVASVFVVDARSNQTSDSSFTRGRVTGSTDALRWLSNSKYSPLMLANHLKGIYSANAID
jgi:hypothetical protein